MRHWVVKVEQKGLHVVSIHIAGIIALLLCSHTEPVFAIRNPGFLNIWFSLMRYHNTAAGTDQLEPEVHPARWLPTNWSGMRSQGQLLVQLQHCTLNCGVEELVQRSVS